MYDLHAHILPGVDDGAKDMDEAVAIARAAADGGTLAMLATPHSVDIDESWSVTHVRKLLGEVAKELRRRGVDLTLLLGMEAHLVPGLPQWATEGRALPINGTRYMLVEMPFTHRPTYLEESLLQLQRQGITPVLAHPERIQAVQECPDLLEDLVGRGMLSQVTAGSVVGYFGEDVRRFTIELLRQGLVHVLASDTHFADGRRSPLLQPGAEAAAEIVGEERARRMVVDAPRAILQGAAVEVLPPVEQAAPRKRRRLRES